MSKRPPLVADKRTPAKKKAAPRKRARKPTSRRGKSGGNPVTWFFRAIFRMVWGIGWRVGALTGIAIAGSVAFYAATLPPVTSILDGRSRGRGSHPTTAHFTRQRGRCRMVANR